MQPSPSTNSGGMVGRRMGSTSQLVKSASRSKIHPLHSHQQPPSSTPHYSQQGEVHDASLNSLNDIVEGSMPSGSSLKNHQHMMIMTNGSTPTPTPAHHPSLGKRSQSYHTLQHSESTSGSTMMSESMSISSSLDDLLASSTQRLSRSQKLVRSFRECCPALNSLQNLLLALFLMQTAICIGSMIVLIYASGESSLEEISVIREKNIKKSVESYMGVAFEALSTLRYGFLIQARDYNYTFPSDYSTICRRVTNVFAPSKNAFPASTIFYYGNNRKNYCGVEKSVTRDYVQVRNDKAETWIYTHNEFYDPINVSLVVENYDPTIRPWYKTGLQNTFPKFAWSTVFNNAFLGCISIASSSKLEFPSFETIRHSNGTIELFSVHHILGIHFDLYNLDAILSNIIRDNMDMQTKSIDVVIVERTGFLISTSFGALTQNEAKQRIHVSKTTSVFALASNELEKRKILIPQSAQTNLSDLSLLIDVNASTTKFMIDQNKISIHYIREDGLDWVMIVSTQEYGFIKTVFTSSPVLLSISIILIVCGTLIMVIVTQIITRSIWSVSRELFKLSKLEIEDIRKRKMLKAIYELSILQTSLYTVKNGLQSFMKFIPRDIVKDIVRTGGTAKLGMQHALTTIMFTDVVDFTNFSETTNSAIIVKVMNEYFNVVTESVEVNEGVIDKYLGDGIMSLFSIPLRMVHEHAVKACLSALTSIVKLDHMKSKCQREGWPIIKMRVGINTGMALIGNIGSRSRLNYTALGDSVNTAGRLEMLNKRYETAILIGQNTYDQVKDRFVCYFVDSVRLKGKSEAIEVYTIECEWSEANHQQKLIHDALVQVKESFYKKDFKAMLEHVDSAIGIVSQNKNMSMSSMQQLAEDGTGGTLFSPSSNSNLSNMNNNTQQTGGVDNSQIYLTSTKFLFDLKKRAEHLKAMTEKHNVTFIQEMSSQPLPQQQMNAMVDYSLTLTEK